MKFSIIIPAYNEENCLPATLEKISKRLSGFDPACEIIVVDNESKDGTAAIAEQFGARVVSEAVHIIARVRNTGGQAASGDVLIFIDADTQVRSSLFEKIAEAMDDKTCFGGAVSVEYEGTQRSWVKYYLLGWKFWEKFFNTKQGAAQFCRRAVFDEMKGFDETIFVGEDVEFYWRLSKFARMHKGHLQFIKDPKVKTSARRFDKMNFWGLILRTNPFFVRLNWRRRSAWKDWYEKAIR